MLWAGSDVLYAREVLAKRGIDRWIASKIHWAVSPWIAEEVCALGLNCEYVQVSFVSPIANPKPLPETFSVLVYVPSLEKADLYGWDQIVEVARAMPRVRFTLLGMNPKQSLEGPPNISIYPWTNETARFYEGSTLLWRPARHDGLSFMVIEALAHGRHVLWSYPFAGCVQVKGAAQAHDEIERLRQFHDAGTLKLNETGIDAIARDFLPETVRGRILERWNRIIESSAPAPSRNSQPDVKRIAFPRSSTTRSIPARTRLVQARATRRVLVHGLPHFGDRFAELMSGDGWDFRFYPDVGAGNLMRMARDLRRSDLVYQIGGRVTVGKFLRAAKFLDKNKIVMHWVGSDTVNERSDVARGRAEPWVIQQLHHWAEADWMVREVEALGLACELIPFPSSRVPDEPSPLPEEFSVLVYMPDTRYSELYRLADILEVARSLPHVPFELVGLLYGSISNAPPNVKVHGRIPDLSEFYRRTTIFWRPVQHDGLSLMVLEAMGYGRHVLWSYPFPGCSHVANASEARDEIIRLETLHQQKRLTQNHDGVAVVAQNYRRRFLRQRILGRLNEILDS